MDVNNIVNSINTEYQRPVDEHGHPIGAPMSPSGPIGYQDQQTKCK